MAATNLITVEGDQGEVHPFWVASSVVRPVGGDGSFDRPHHGDPMGIIKKLYPGTSWKIRWAERDAGWHYSHMYMGDYGRDTSFDPPLKPALRRAMITALEREEILQEDLRGISRVITPCVATKKAFGSRIRNLLIMACTEVEAQCKAILAANGYKAKPNKHLNITDYVKLAAPLRLSDFVVSCDRFPDYPHFSPFHGWKPKASPPWWTAYNATKHDAGGSASEATLEHAISAVGAAGILLLAQFGGAYMNELGAVPFFALIEIPNWEAHERNYPPPPGERWSAFPYKF